MIYLLMKYLKEICQRPVKILQPPIAKFSQNLGI